MANVLLTTQCNLHCPYCFAKDRIENSNKTMSVTDAGRVISFLTRSNHWLFRVMGGEPTLHPQFADIVEMALQANMCVDVLSNATWQASLNDIFRRVSPRRLRFLLNIDHPSQYRPSIWSRIENNLARISEGGDVTLSFNIFRIPPAYEYILDLSKRFSIRHIRLSFSLPILGKSNTYIALEQYDAAVPFIIDFVRQAAELGTDVKMDNAVPLCIFSNEHAGELLLNGVLDLTRNGHCEPVIDIGPDLQVWPCFCLSTLWNRHLEEFETLQQIVDYYRQAFALYQGHLYPMEKCTQCTLRDRWFCQGGCLTFTVLRHGMPQETFKGKELSAAARTCTGKVRWSPRVQFRHYDIPCESTTAWNGEARLEVEVDSSMQALIPLLDGSRTLKEVVDNFTSATMGTSGQSVFFELSERFIKQRVTGLVGSLIDRGFVLEEPN